MIIPKDYSLKKPILIIFLIILLPIAMFGQSRIYFENILDTSNTKTVRLMALDSLLSQTFRSDNDAFIEYSNQYIDLAEDIGLVEDAARKAMNLQHPLTNYRNDPVNAIKIINSVLTRKYKIKDSILLGGLYLKRGRAHAKINLQKAIEDFTISLNNYAKNDTLHRADVYLFRGQAYSNRGKFVNASEDFTSAYKLYENKKEYRYMVYAQQGIINMFSMNGFYEKAKKERDLLIEKMKELRLDSFLANEYYNQALDYRKTGDRGSEHRTLLKAEEVFDTTSSNLYTLIGIHSLLISYYCDHLQLDEAKKHLDLLEALDYDLKGDLPSEINYLGGKADYLRVIGELDGALALIERKLKLSQQLGIEDNIMEAHYLLSEIYFQKGDLLKSIENSKAASTIKDSIYNKSSANALAYYQTLYETERKERELIEKSTNISLLKKDSENFKKLMLFGSIATFFGFILLLLYRNHRYLRNHKLLQESYSQELLSFQESERRRISKDLHDGVGQQLLVIKNRLIFFGDEDTKTLVDSTIEEVRAISRDLHPFQLQELGITKAIEFTLNQIDENTALFISSDIDNIDNIFSKEDEVNIYRIIQESLSNILKHAKAEASKVSVKKSSNNIIISIRDNGIGFDFSDKYQDTKSLGLKTLLERTKFLNGQMKVTSKRDSGTVLEFQFPI